MARHNVSHYIFSIRNIDNMRAKFKCALFCFVCAHFVLVVVNVLVLCWCWSCDTQFQLIQYLTCMRETKKKTVKHKNIKTIVGSNDRKHTQKKSQHFSIRSRQIWGWLSSIFMFALKELPLTAFICATHFTFLPIVCLHTQHCPSINWCYSAHQGPYTHHQSGVYYRVIVVIAT